MATGVLDEGSNFNFNEPEPDVQVTPLEKESVDLTSSKKWPHIVEAIREKQKFWNQYFPLSDTMKGKPAAEKGVWWEAAATMINDLESIINDLEGIADATRQHLPKGGSDSSK